MANENNSSETEGNQNNQQVELTGNDAVIKALQAEIAGKDAFISKLRDKENQWEKDTKKLEKYEGMLKGIIQSKIESIPEGVRGDLSKYPLELQISLLDTFSKMVPAVQDAQTQQKQAPQQPTYVPNVVPAQSVMSSESELARKKMQEQKGRPLTGAELFELARKHAPIGDNKL